MESSRTTQAIEKIAEALTRMADQMEKMNEKLENSHIHSNKSKHTPCSGIDMHERTCRCPDCECIAYNQESNEGTEADEGTEGDESAEADKGTALDHGVYQ